ncbi:unnamed protein product [Spirodela intermedia]|uniref:Uncharacterized protein n=2 Tax=Spirodela intermedia TaxID=51605 RepID=A0A7I8LGK2_SPIIN|nr:unnamed protein product [Spirodela intermedia]CAA6671682.1 unnamed protein product [Spirodela intermedia]CAA7408796.1 unnamed protein product [Spirodela intermedia]
MSAHETTPGHAVSTAALTVSITSNPSRLRLGVASFSARWPLVELSSTEPSQPWQKNRSNTGSYNVKMM